MARNIYIFMCLAALATTSPALALQLTNRDTADHKVAMTEPSGTQDVMIKQAQVIDGICKAGCTMKMADGEEYEFDGNEIVSIEEGLMFLDEPADGSSAATSGSEEPADADKAGAAAVPTPPPGADAAGQDKK